LRQKSITWGFHDYTQCVCVSYVFCMCFFSSQFFNASRLRDLISLDSASPCLLALLALSTVHAVLVSKA
jgi:hypothetical protein